MMKCLKEKKVQKISCIMQKNKRGNSKKYRKPYSLYVPLRIKLI